MCLERLLFVFPNKIKFHGTQMSLLFLTAGISHELFCKAELSRQKAAALYNAVPAKVTSHKQ